MSNDKVRPLDTLNDARGDKVLVELKNGKTYTGTLKSFDIHINTVLEDAEEHKDEETEQLGTVFIRGDTVTLITPQ